MQRFLVRRFFISIITLLVVSVVIFAMSRASGDPRHIFLDDYSTQEDWDRLTVSLGLDKPYYQQYGIFLSDAMQGNFGVSIKEKRPVVDIIGERVAATIQLGGAAFLRRGRSACRRAPSLSFPRRASPAAHEGTPPAGWTRPWP